VAFCFALQQYTHRLSRVRSGAFSRHERQQVRRDRIDVDYCLLISNDYTEAARAVPHRRRLFEGG
jgi:uncharacterized protein with ACT and thioredoxin-like domain